jgi:transposase InsO family protein
VHFPSAGTLHFWLKKNGLTRTQKRRKQTPPSLTPLSTATTPNEIWATDFKGQFRLGDEKLCYPLTVTDLFSRYIVGCEALEDTKAAPAWEVFEKLFSEYGLPSTIRSDNGVPFASPGLAGLTTLSVKWLRLGIRLERIEPAHPQQNGQHERMHRTLKEETTRPAGANVLQQQERFDAFVEEFNQIRPHQGIEMRCPATLYRPSERRYSRLPELSYPLADDVRIVRPPGIISFAKHSQCYLSQALVGEKVGIREVTDGYWLITYATLDLGYFDERDMAFVPMDEAKSNKPSPISLD